MPQKATLPSLNHWYERCSDFARNVGNVATQGISDAVAIANMRDSVRTLPTKAVLAHILHPNQNLALQYLRDHASTDEFMRNARAKFGAMSLMRQFRNIQLGEPVVGAHREIFSALRERFVTPVPASLDQLRHELSVLHARARDLQLILIAAPEPALHNQQHFLSTLRDLIDALNACARDVSIAAYLFGLPSSDVWVSEFPRLTNPTLPIVTGSMPRAGTATRQPGAPVVGRQSVTDISPASAAATTSTSGTKASVPISTKRHEPFQPGERSSAIVLAAATIGFVAITAAFAVASLALLPWSSAAFAVSASPAVALCATVRIGRAIWTAYGSTRIIQPSAEAESKRRQAGFWQLLGRKFFAPSGPVLATAVGSLGGAASGAGAAWLGMLSTSALAVAAPLSSCAGAALGFAWARRTRAPLGSAPAA